MTTALSTVASERSYSRTTGSTSVEAVTAMPGRASRRISATRLSCAGLAKECSSHTAPASTPSARHSTAAVRTLASSSASTTAPPGPIRSLTSSTREAGTGRAGFTQALKLERRGMSCRPMVRPWRKPRVVTRAALAPFPSRIMLVATVVPCRTRSREGSAWPASASARRTPVRNAWEGSAGTLGVLARQIRPLFASCRAMSVKVPPISTAMASDVSGEGVDILIAVKSAGCRPPRAQRRRGGEVEGAVRHDDAIVLAGGVDADEAAQYVLEHFLPGAVERMAIAAAAAGRDPQHVAALDPVAVGERRDDTLVGGAGIDHDASGPAGHAAGDAPRWIFHAVDADGDHGLLGQDVVLAHDAAAAAKFPGAARILDDRVGARPHRIADFQELDGVVLLRHEIDGVDAVGVGPRAIADADAVGQQERLQLALFVAEGAADQGNDIGGMSGRRLAAGDVDEAIEGGQEAHQRQSAHAERGGKARPQQGALAQAHFIERLRPAGIADLGRVAAQEIETERRPGNIGIHQ